MTTTNSDIPLARIARVAGVGYLIIFITGIFANFLVLENLFAPGDPATTAHNILSNEMLFRSAIFSFVIMFLADVVLAWALYLLLKPVHQNLSLLSGWLRLVNGAVFGIALFNLPQVLKILKGTEYISILEAGQRQAQAMLSLHAFNHTWLVGLVFFGAHLLVLGYLIVKSGYIPRFIGILLLIAGGGYLIDSLANFLLPVYQSYQDIFQMLVIIPGVVGELWFTFWLLLRGSKIDDRRLAL
ncbi:MAG: DUF4386 domain-containing protein [Calditrichia bacterium]